MAFTSTFRKNSTTKIYFLTLVGIILITKPVKGQTFTSGNIAVFVTASATANNTTGSVVELNTTTAGQTPVNTYTIDGTTAGTALRFSGSASSTGYLSNSNDGYYLYFTGGSTTTTSVNINTIVPRAVGSFNPSGIFAATTYSGTSGNQTRSATSLDNTTIFVGDQGGFYSNGTSAASPSGNIRSVKAFGGSVYYFTASASATPVGTISSATGGTITPLPGLATGATTRTDFYLISSGSNGSAFDVLYISDATSATVGAIYKYSLVSGSWVANGSYATTFGGFGLSAEVQGGGANLYLSSGTGATAANSVIKLNDAAGYNSTINITTASNVTLYTAAAGTTVKGVAFAPVCRNPVITSLSNNSPICSGNNLTFSISATGHIPLSYSWAGPNSYSSSTQNASVSSAGTAASGTYSITVSNSCNSANSSSTATVNPSPVTYTVTGGGSYCQGGSGVAVGLSNSDAGVNYQLMDGTNTIGAPVSGTGSAISFNNQTNATTYTVTATDATTSCASDMNGNAVVTITSTVTPSISISVPSATVCSGSNTTFSATTTNAGSFPVYQWLLNGAPVGTNSTSYSNNSLSNNDMVSCTFTSNATCATATTLTSNTITITVSTSVTPSVTITSGTGLSNCSGTNVTFSASPVNGGSAPSYSWALNGNPVGTNSDSYSNNTLNDQDMVSCTMASSDACASPANATANTLTMTVIPNVTPSVNLSINPSGAICAGISVSFTANATNGGSSPIYQWTKNSSNVSTGNTYTDAGLVNGDVVACVLTSNAACATTSTVSASTTMTVNPNPTPSISGTFSFCPSGSTTLDAGAGYASYLWSNSATTQTISVSTGGTYSVTVSDGTCSGSSSTVTVTAANAPSQPAAFTTSSSNVVVGQSGVVYTVPNDPTVTYTWTYSGTGATINGTGNSVTVDFSGSATSGTLSVTATNSCGTSTPRTIAINVTLSPVFGTGNLVLLMTSGTASKVPSPITLKEITTSGAPGMTVAIPAGGSTPLQTSGVFGGSEGFLTTSSDQQYLVFTGYSTSMSTGDVTATSAASAPRAIGIVYPSGSFQQVYSSTTDFDGNDIRGAISDGTNFWASGASAASVDGIDYFGPGTPAGLGTGATPPKGYAIRIFNGQIYYSTQKAGPTNTTSQLGVFSFGSGLPTNGSPAPTQLINTGTTVVEDFSINPTTDVCYIAVNLNTSAGGIQKWTKSGSVWSLAYTLGTGIANTGAYGLVVDYSGPNPVIYATTFDAGGNRVIKITDTGAGSTASTLVAAAANVYYKGITFAPVATGTPKVNLTVSQDTASEQLQTVVLVKANTSAPVTGTQTVALTISGTNITTGDYTISSNTITIPAGSTSGTVTFTVTDDALAEAFIETAVLTIGSPSSGIVLGTGITQNIKITDNEGNNPPTILMDVVSTTDYIDGAASTSPASPFSVSGTQGDPTDPVKTLGVDFIINDPETAASSLTVTAVSSNTLVVPNGNISLTGSGASRNIKITPVNIGYSNISVTVSDGVNNTSYVIYFASSDASPNLVPVNTFWHTGLSDASDAIAIDDNYYMTGDDELDYINVYSRSHSGLEVKSFDVTNLLNLPDPAKPETDIEAAAPSLKNNNRSYWLGSMSNLKGPSFLNAPNRDRLFATHHSGTGAATNITYIGYSAIKSALLTWGDSYGYNFTASAAAGMDSKSLDGFSAEGMVFAPDSTTLWIGLRAPLVPTTNRTKAVLAPILNFEAWFNNGNQVGSPTFGPPIELDLNMNGVREIIRLSNGTYVIIAGSPLDAAGMNEVYKWTGNPADAPIHVPSAGGGNINMEGAMEVHTGGNLSLTKLQVISDNGANIYYNDAIEAKDFGDLNLRKFRSDVLTNIDLTICTSYSVSVTASGNTTFCQGDSVTLTANASTAGTYSWSTGSAAQSITVKTGGVYSVTVSNSTSGCSSTQTATVVVNVPSTPAITVSGAVLTSSSASTYQWYLNGNPITSATSQSYTVSQNGNYQVETTDANGCTAMSGTTTVNSMSIVTIQSKSQANVKPNPFENYFELEFNAQGGNCIVEIYNSIGEKVGTLFNGEIGKGETTLKFTDLPGLQNGIYLLKLQNNGLNKVMRISQAK